MPLEDPILKFLLILVIILAAPLLLNKLKIPYLLGLIIAGAVIGPHGLNLVLRDSSIILSGTAGLLYIMFLSGLDMDMSDFKKNSWRSLIFGLYTFCVPLGLGILAGYYILGFPIYSSILLAGLFASQTLIAYPIVSKLGISRDKAVTIAVGGTVITDTLALLLLTVIVGMAPGTVADMFWWRLAGSVSLCIAIIVFLFPRQLGLTEDASFAVSAMFRLRCVRDELLTGAMIFSAVFLLNEPYTCAHHRLGRILYGIMVGAFTMGFRYFGVYETGVCFAILAVNSISGWLDRTEVRLHELIKSGGHFKEKKTGKGDAE